MSLLRTVRLRLRALFARDALDRDIDEELRFHIEMQTEQYLRAGMSPAEARRRAVLLFGGVEGHREESRRAQGWELMGLRASWLDFKLGLRMLRKYPGLTLVGGLALTVATGLGAAFFEFSLDMFDPRLPIPGGDRIVTVQNWDLAEGGPERRTLRDFATWRAEVRSIEHLAAVQTLDQSVTTEEGYTETLGVARTTASLLRAGGVAPLLGRPLLEEDERPGAPPVAVLGHAVWQRFFGGDPGVVGRTLRVGADQATVVGVMPEGYGFPINHQVWTALRADALAYGPREGPSVTVFGRLRNGRELAEAQAELAAIGARATADLPETHERLRPRVLTFAQALRQAMGGEASSVAINGIRFLFLLLMVVMCVNVTTLVFARTASRESEFAVRSALGAGRRRIVLQLFLEALALTLVSAAIGLAAAWWGLRWGMALFWRVQDEAAPPFWWNDALSPATVAYVLALAVVGAAMVGIVPALKVTGRQVQPTLSQKAAGSPRLRFGGIWTVVVVLQVALSVAFLPTAILAGRGALRDAERSTGFPADAYLAGRLFRELEVPLDDLPEAERAEVMARSAALEEEVLRRVSAEQGVDAVAYASSIPGLNHVYEALALDYDVPSPPDSVVEPYGRSLAVDPDYFAVIGAPIVAGRAFRPADAESGTVAIVSRTFVREVMRGQNPVGARIRYPERPEGNRELWYEVVGVVEDPDMDAFGPGKHAAVYHPRRPGRNASLQMFVRVGPRASALGPRIRSVVTSVDPSLRLGELQTVRAIWEPVHRSERFLAAMQGVVALVALLLSMAGIHALMAFTVARRTREIGIRTALGARPRRIVAAIFSRAFGQLGLGVLLGTVFAAVVRRDLLATEGPAMLLAIVATMLAVGLLACWVPARRALRVDPTEALRSEG